MVLLTAFCAARMTSFAIWALISLTDWRVKREIRDESCEVWRCLTYSFQYEDTKVQDLVLPRSTSQQDQEKKLQPCYQLLARHEQESRLVPNLSVQAEWVRQSATGMMNNNEPGKIYMLFPCPGYSGWPKYCCSGKGEPEAKITVPRVCSTASANEHSESLTGLDRGKMIGRRLIAAIALMTSGVKAPYGKKMNRSKHM